jgi:uncharacterized protein (DUF1778 family)
MPTEPSRRSRDQLRNTSDALAAVKRAAEIESRIVSDFIVATASETARRTIEETHLIRLSIEDQQRFVELLVNPPPVPPALRRAAKTHSRLIRESR